MKNILLLIVLVMTPRLVNAQCGPPPPPALTTIYSVDMDNDGLAPFDIEYYITYVLRPNMEQAYSETSSAYNVNFYNGASVLSGPIYTNVEPNEIGSVNFEYTGTGPQFMPLPPCNWPVMMNSGLKLTAVPFDGDFDEDGILNEHEDSNGNLNLMDDDYDNDGIVNLEDADDLMSVSMFSDPRMVIFPNPAKSVFHVQSLSAITTVSISDLGGKTVAEYNSPTSEIAIAQLSKGMYIVTIKSERSTTIKKLIVE